MTIYGLRRGVACYVTRGTEAGVELLVFDAEGPDATGSSRVQVPAGDMLPFESVDVAAMRCIESDTGLVGASFEAQLGADERGPHEPAGPSLTTYVHVSAPGGGRQSWHHTVSADDGDGAISHWCRWERMPLRCELMAGSGAYLDRLTG